MRLTSIFGQDYTEAFQGHSQTRILELFKWRYAHPLIVSLATKMSCIVIVQISMVIVSNFMNSLLGSGWYRGTTFPAIWRG